MAQDIQLGIKLKFDGKDVEGGLSISREQLRQFAVDAKRAGESASGSFTSAARGVRFRSIPACAGETSAHECRAFIDRRPFNPYLPPVARQQSDKSSASSETATGGT